MQKTLSECSLNFLAEFAALEARLSMETLTFVMTSSFYPPYHVGGACIAVKNLAEELARMGHEVHVFHSLDAYYVKKKNYPAVTKGQSIQQTGVRSHIVKTPFHVSAYLSYALGSYHPTVRQFERLIKDVRPDVVHHHNISLLGHQILRKPADYLNLYTAHDYWLICQQNDLVRQESRVCETASCVLCALAHGRPPQLWRYGSGFRDSISQIDSLIAPSNYLKSRISEKIGFIKQVVIPNFVPEPSPHVPLRSQFHGFFLYAGRLEKYKGILELLDACRTIDVKLIVAGDGPLKDRVSIFISRHELNSKVIFLGHVGHTSLMPLLANADALIVPSTCAENSPLIALEALSVGTPVIASDRGGLPEIVEKVDRSLIYDSPTRLAQILSNFDRATYSSDAIRMVYERYYSAPAFMQKYLALVDRSFVNKADNR
jgi:glycosyltransferase involved in cell wall biosynthesis